MANSIKARGNDYMWISKLIVLLLLIGCAQQYLNQSGDKFVIVVLPDTQHYSASHPAIFDSQVKWIIDNKDSIDFVVHLGDVVNSYDRIHEWENAKSSLSKLDNKVPYMVIPGNHDCGQDNMNFLNYKKYISLKLNDCAFVTKGENSLLILGMQWNPDAEILQWADDILEYHCDLPALIFTHEYLDKNGQRSAMGEKIWQELISKHGNVILVLNGHFFGNATKVDSIDGQPVFQCLSNYQHLKNGGNGWLRIYTIDVKTYSPWLRGYNKNECFILRR